MYTKIFMYVYKYVFLVKLCIIINFTFRDTEVLQEGVRENRLARKHMKVKIAIEKISGHSSPRWRTVEVLNAYYSHMSIESKGMRARINDCKVSKLQVLQSDPHRRGNLGPVCVFEFKA